MISELQKQLNDIYQVGGYDVRDFLITDRRVARCLGQEAMLASTSESLLVAEDEQGLAVSLYLDSGMIERLESAKPLDRLHADQLDDFFKVLEGISHFNCMVWKASQEREVSLLELELQAEVDKFVATMQLALGQRDTDLQNRLHAVLFDKVRFSEELDREQLDRYQAANELAARFCRGLRHRLVENGQGALGELRRFFRLQLSDKVSHIRSTAY